ncbi:MAG: hypothetical protein COB37_04855 [Kordiimonadales bacterium]|nr:MAG: hypothetical protein COB37_04855 [Kordiimonadales bacterium]
METAFYQPVCSRVSLPPNGKGLIVIDLDTGDTVHWLHIEGIVSELYDVAVLPGIKRPTMTGFQSDEIRWVIKIGQGA